MLCGAQPRLCWPLPLHLLAHYNEGDGSIKAAIGSRNGPEIGRTRIKNKRIKYQTLMIICRRCVDVTLKVYFKDYKLISLHLDYFVSVCCVQWMGALYRDKALPQQHYLQASKQQIFLKIGYHFAIF